MSNSNIKYIKYVEHTLINELILYLVDLGMHMHWVTLAAAISGNK